MSDDEVQESISTDTKRVSKAKAKNNSKNQKSDKVKCPQCDSFVSTYSLAEATYFTAICAMITVTFFNIWSICLLPFVIPLSKAIVVRCGRCDYKLETHQPFGLLSLQDEVMTLKCGECALVISRTYLLIASGLVSLGIIYVWASNEIAISKPNVFLNTTWPEYLKDCGGEVVLQNSIRAAETFAGKYEGNTISWDGFLMRVTQNVGWFSGDHAVVLLVKMQPSESDIHADLILSMDLNHFHDSKDEIIKLDKGSKFKFNATFISVGNEQQLHHLHAHSIESTEGFLDIPDHVHSVNHRYSLKP